MVSYQVFRFIYNPDAPEEIYQSGQFYYKQYCLVTQMTFHLHQVSRATELEN